MTGVPWNMTAMFMSLRNEALTRTKTELLATMLAYAGGSVQKLEKMALFGAMKIQGQDMILTLSRTLTPTLTITLNPDPNPD